MDISGKNGETLRNWIRRLVVVVFAAAGVLFIYGALAAVELRAEEKTFVKFELGGEEHATIRSGNVTYSDGSTETINFSRWTDTQKVPSKQKANYYLDADIELAEDCELKNNIRLCLNGHSVKLNHHVISCGASKTLTIYEKIGGTGMIYGASRGVYVTGGTLNLFGGKISNSYIGVQVTGNGTFNMYGGEISDNENDIKGAGVLITKGQFNMYGGKISGNRTYRGPSQTDDKNGAGVYIDSTEGNVFTMSGGEITGNYADGNGGGVYICYESSKFIMTGGTISGNTVADGKKGKNLCIKDGFVGLSGGTIDKSDGGVEFLSEAASVNVGFNANGGTGTMSPQALSGGTGTLNRNSFRNSDKIFDGWNTNTDGSGARIADGASVYLRSDITLYAQWIPYTLTLIDTTGTVSNNRLDYLPSDTVTLPKPTRKTYRFSKWIVSQAGGNWKVGEEFDSKNLTLSGRYGNATLEVEWKNKDNCYPTVSISDWVYGESPSAPVVKSIPSHSVVTYEYKPKAASDDSYSGTVPSEAGEYSLRVNVEETDDYLSATATTVFKINRKAVTVTADNKSKVVGEADPPLTATVTGLIGNDTVGYTLSREKGEKSGTYAITPSGPEEQGNYLVSFLPGMFTIHKADPFITKTPAAIENLAYNGNAQTLITEGEADGGTFVYAVTEIGEAAPADKLYNTSVPKKTNAGRYTVYYKVIGDADHSSTPSRGINVAISKREPAVSLDNITRNVNKDKDNIGVPISSVVPADSGTISSYSINGAVVFSGSVTVSNAAVSNEGVVTAELQGGTENDTITIPVKIIAQNYDCTLSIVITLKDKEDPVFEAPAANALIYNGSEQKLVRNGLVTTGGELKYCKIKDGTYSTDIPTGKDAGNYTVYYMITETDSVNGIDPIPVNVSIARKTVTVKADSKTKKKGKNDPELTASVEGLVDGEPENLISYSITREGGETAGTYTVVVSGEAEQGNYSVIFETGTLTISDGSNNGEEGKKVESKEDEPRKIKGKVPFTEDGEFYASSLDNFAAESGSGKITGLVLDFSKVAESDVNPSDLKMTAIRGSRFTTKSRLKDKNSAKATGGVKVKVNKKTRIPSITCKKDGSVTLTMEDGVTYIVTITVQKPKAQKRAKRLGKGSTPVIKTIKDLFGTDIDAGTLKILKQKHSQASLSDNKLIVDPKNMDSIKILYQYLNEKYKMTLKVK